MIKTKITDKGRAIIKDSCKTQAQRMGEIYATIRKLAQYAMLRAIETESLTHILTTAKMFGTIFDDALTDIEKMLKAGIDVNDELEAQDIDVTVDMNDIDEIMKQLKEMQDGEEE